MKVNINLQYEIDLSNCSIDTLTYLWQEYHTKIFSDVANQILSQVSNYYMSKAEKPFSCECGNNRDIIWKSRRAGVTFIDTIFCKLSLNQLQVQCKKCGKKMFITRKLLNLRPYSRMSELTRRAFALIGSLSAYRVSEKILSLLGVSINKMKLWRCVQRVGSCIDLSNSAEVCKRSIFEADGTGIPIRGVKKRGKEVKIVLQRVLDKGCEKLRIVGLNLSDYHSKVGWKQLFSPLLSVFSEIKECMLITDGDISILAGVKNVEIFIQRCLWHLPHQLKYVMREDKIKNKSEEWYYILCKLYEIVTLPKLIYDSEEIKRIISSKKFLLNELIDYCKLKNYNSVVSYLENAKPHVFTSFEQKMNGKSTSKVERVMKTINVRVNVGKWSTSGVTNLLKIRLSYYYNEFDVVFTHFNCGEVKLKKAS